MLRLALTKLVEIVGEAAKQVTDEGRAEMPDVPWSAAARTRDRLVHPYFDVDLGADVAGRVCAAGVTVSGAAFDEVHDRPGDQLRTRWDPDVGAVVVVG